MTAMFGTLPSIADSETWFYLAGGIGAVALAIGFVAAAAGLLFGWKMNRTQQGKTAIQIAKVESAAKERIATVETAANERIETARAEAAKEAQRIEANANQKIEEARAQAQSDVAAARVRQDEIALELRGKDKELADAQRAADEARLALQKHLEEVAERQRQETERQAPRVIDSAQKQQILNRLLRSPKASVTLEFLANDTESRRFADQIKAILLEAGWTVSGPESSIFGGVPQGLLIFVPDVHDVAGIVLQEAFTAAGIPAPGVLSKDRRGLRLTVGHKPNKP